MQNWPVTFAPYLAAYTISADKNEARIKSKTNGGLMLPPETYASLNTFTSNTPYVPLILSIAIIVNIQKVKSRIEHQKGHRENLDKTSKTAGRFRGLSRKKMKITRDKIAPDYFHPLTDDEIALAINLVPGFDQSCIKHVRLGCSTKTTKEGHVQREHPGYSIPINFCPKNMITKLHKIDGGYSKYIAKFSSHIDSKKRLVHWNETEAKKYCLFILLHEIGHIVYREHFNENKHIHGWSGKIEKWCDKYAFDLVNQIWPQIE